MLSVRMVLEQWANKLFEKDRKMHTKNPQAEQDRALGCPMHDVEQVWDTNRVVFNSRPLARMGKRACSSKKAAIARGPLLNHMARRHPLVGLRHDRLVPERARDRTVAGRPEGGRD
jgi:hypothetical protein